jgi:hypothetical protein
MRPFLWICLIVFAAVMEMLYRATNALIAAYGPLIVIPMLMALFAYAVLVDRREGRY